MSETNINGVFLLREVRERILKDIWPIEYEQDNNGWFSGGSNPAVPSFTISTIDRITFASDTSTALVRGPLSVVRFSSASTGNQSFGWVGGGEISTSNLLSSIDRITFASDTSTASVRGSLSVSRTRFNATKSSLGNNKSYGWFVTGASPFSPINILSTIDRMTFSSDTSTASLRGNLDQSKYGHNITTGIDYAWVAGGFVTPSAVSISNISRITFDSDTDTSLSRGLLSRNLSAMATVNDNTYGWFAGGYDNPVTGSLTAIYRMDFSTDTATTATRGNLSLTKDTFSGVNDYSYGWFSTSNRRTASNSGFSTTSIVDRMTFVSDTATTVTRGNASFDRSGTSGISGIV